MSDWQDMIVGDRMVVDNEFSARIDNSPFSRQEWGLVMTATTLRIENPADENAAELVADTSDLRSMMPEVEKVANMGPMGRPQRQESSGGLLDSVFEALGIGSSAADEPEVDEQKLEAAKTLTSEYAAELQRHLEDEGRWGEIRERAATADDST